ncbi:MAG: hypothetical protein KC496_17715 [Anaerolineae bacterium]|nr:hypothetical protein [Anaerolineae bacterium]
MQLTCPNCGETVPAEHINIQQMVAVCPSCDSVFSFTAPDEPGEKTKRRKVKQPDDLTLYDGERLELAFRTNWRMDQDESFMGAAILGGVFSLIAFIMLGGTLQGEIPFFLPLFMGIIATSADYAIALRLFNQTHITMDSEEISISRRPLPGLRAPQHVSLSGVIAIHAEETLASRENHYDTPRFRVWAETVDGTQRTIATDLVEEYAYFVAQRLQERLDLLNDVDVSRLDADQETDNEAISPQMMVEDMQNQQRCSASQKAALALPSFFSHLR